MVLHYSQQSSCDALSYASFGMDFPLPPYYGGLSRKKNLKEAEAMRGRDVGLVA